jgi:hypothetical protein
MKSAEDRFENYKARMKESGRLAAGASRVDLDRTREAFAHQYEIERKMHELCCAHGISVCSFPHYMAFAKSADKLFRRSGDCFAFRLELDIITYAWKRRGCDEALLNVIVKELFDVTPGKVKPGGEAA